MQDNPDAGRQPKVPADIARYALIAFGIIAAGVTVIAVIESYTNLYEFARAYGLSGWRASIAPGAVDSFIVMGELLLFAAILLRWGKTAHILGAAMAAWGFLLSVGGNVWHAHAAAVADRAVSAIWPVTATAGLAGALLIVRQAMAARRAPPPPPSPLRREEPRRAVPRRVQASAPAGLAAVRAAEDRALLDKLLAWPGPLPSARKLAEAEHTHRRRAGKILATAKAERNGHDRPGA